MRRLPFAPCAGISAICRLTWEAPGRALLVDAARAEALVRCVQEVITNTLKHATASNLWIISHPSRGE